MTRKKQPDPAPIELEIHGVRIHVNKLAWPIPAFADVVGHGATTIREEIEAGNLIARYTRPEKRVITIFDAAEWLQNAPIDKPDKQ